jgi:hypothetical protein
LAHTTAFASETKETLKKVARTNNKAFIVLSLVPAAFRAAVMLMLTGTQEESFLTM